MAGHGTRHHRIGQCFEIYLTWICAIQIVHRFARTECASEWALCYYFSTIIHIIGKTSDRITHQTTQPAKQTKFISSLDLFFLFFTFSHSKTTLIRLVAFSLVNRDESHCVRASHHFTKDHILYQSLIEKEKLLLECKQRDTKWIDKHVCWMCVCVFVCCKNCDKCPKEMEKVNKLWHLVLKAKQWNCYQWKHSQNAFDEYEVLATHSYFSKSIQLLDSSLKRKIYANEQKLNIYNIRRRQCMYGCCYAVMVNEVFRFEDMRTCQRWTWIAAILFSLNHSSLFSSYLLLSFEIRSRTYSSIVHFVSKRCSFVAICSSNYGKIEVLEIE